MPKWVSDFLQVIFAHLLWEFGLATGVGTVIATLKAKKEKWAGPLLYGFIAFTLVFVLGFAVTGRSPLTKSEVVTTPDDIMQWVISAGDSVGEEGQDKEQLDITDNGILMFVRQRSQHQGYVTVQVNTSLSADQKNLFAKLTDTQKNTLDHRIAVQVSQLGFRNLPLSGWNVYVPIFRDIPIETIKKGTFLSALDELRRCDIIMQDELQHDFQEIKKQS